MGKQKDCATISFGGDVKVKAKKIYLISDDELIEKIDALIAKEDNILQTLDDGGEETEGGNK